MTLMRINRSKRAYFIQNRSETKLYVTSQASVVQIAIPSTLRVLKRMSRNVILASSLIRAVLPNLLWLCASGKFSSVQQSLTQQRRVPAAAYSST